MKTLKYVFCGIIIFLFGILAGSILLEKGNGRGKEDGVGETEQAVPVITDETQLSDQAVILNPAQCIVLEKPMQLIHREGTASGTCIWIPEGAGKPPTVLGKAVFEFTVKEADDYSVWVRTNWEDGCSNSIHAAVNDQAPYIVGEDGTYGYWKWRKGPTVRLSIGTHKLELRNREDGVKIDQILITPDRTYEPAGIYAKESHVSNIHANLIKLMPGDENLSGVRTETIHFTDDFMRKENELGGWRSASGLWRIYSVKERTHSRKSGVVARSVNPFSLKGEIKKEGQTALITTGRNSWINYAVESSVKVLKGGSGGVCMNCDTDGNRYQLLICENWPHAGRAVLEKVTSEKKTIFHEMKIDVRQGQWYRMRLENSAGKIKAHIDEVCIFEGLDKKMAPGRIGLAASGSGAFFDDVAAHGFSRMAFDFSSADQLKSWEFDPAWGLSTPVASEKTVKQIMMSDLHGRHVPAADILSLSRFDSSPGYLYTGNKAWKNYEVSFDVWLSSDGVWEFHFYRTHENTTAKIIFEKINRKWTGRMVRIAESREEVLAQTQIPVDDAKWVQMKLSCHDGFIQFYINGKQVLAAVDSILKGGGFGFRTNGNSGIFIDNLSIEFAPAERFLFAEHDIFKRETTMKDWAWKKNEWEQDAANKRWIHRRDFRGNVTCIIPEAVFSDNSIYMIIKGSRTDEHQGCKVTVAEQGETTTRITLSENGILLKQTEIPTVSDSTHKVMFREQGGFYLVYIDDMLVLWSPKKEPPNGTAIILSDAVGDIEKVDICAANTRDYFFHVAPVDWYPGAGNWEVRNRWRCAPQWSWFGALEKQGCSVIWSKRHFDGDLTLDVYCSFKMLKQRPPYNTHDLNITICGNGRSLEQGYSFIYGGWRNSATAIMKNGKVVARTDKVLAPSPIHGMPNTNTLHRRWFFFRIEKKEDTITYFFDDKKVLEYKDPEPIHGGHVGIWTQDNGMMLARARISYSHETLSIPQRKTVTRLETAAEKPESGIHLKSAPYIMMGWDFQSTNHGWKALDKNINLIPSQEDGNRFLAAISDEPGSRWRISVTEKKTDLAATPCLSFRYALDPQSRINLYLRRKGMLYRILLSGPDDASGNIRDIGRISNFTCDGKWHTAFVNLYSLLTAILPADEDATIEQIYFGVEEINSYLPSGIGGNPTGTKMQVDDFYLFGVRQKDSVLTFSLPREEQKKNKWVLKQTFRDQANQRVGTSEKVVVENTDLLDIALPNATGLRYLELTDETTNKHQHIRVPGLYDNTSPQITKTQRPEPVSGICELIVKDMESGVDIRTAVLSLPDHREKTISYNRQVFRYRPQHGLLAIDFQKAGISIPATDPSKVVAIFRVKNLAGIETSVDILARDFPENDTRPPLPCDVSGRIVMAENDFDHSWHGWVANPDVYLELAERETTTPNTDDRCLKVTGLQKSASLRIEYPVEFNPEEYPLIQFDYKVPARADVDLYLNTNVEKWVRIRLSDTNADPRIAFDVKEFKEDDQWHTCRLNLGQIMRKAFPDKMKYHVSRIVFCDGGFRGCLPYTSFCIDNVSITGFTRNQDSEIIEISTGDCNGLNSIQMQIIPLASQKAIFDERLNARNNTIRFTLPQNNDGEYLLKFAGIDNFGNPSIVRQIPLLYDSTAQVVKMIYPQPASSAASSKIVFQFPKKDPVDSGFNHIELKVNGQSYSEESKQLRIDRNSNKLTWNIYHIDDSTVFADKQRINVSLNVTDTAGNVSHPLHHYWTMDYSKDRKPPVIQQAYILARTVKRSDTFEKDMATWRNRDRRRGSHLSRVVDENTIGRHVLCMKNMRNNGYFSARIIKKKFRVETYPYIRFLYKISPNTQLDFLVGTQHGWRTIMFTDTKSSYKSIGRIPGVQADNQWHQGFIDLAGFMEKAFPDDKKRFVTELAIGDWGLRKNKKGKKAYFDDFLFLSKEPNKPQVVLNRMEEPTGFSAAAVLVDSHPSTVPHTNPQNIFKHQSGPIPFRAELLTKGTYLHVAVRDGAGNWSQPYHIHLEEQRFPVQ